MRTARIWMVAAGGALMALSAVHAQPGFGGFGREELKLVEQFDKDGNGRLDATERKAARGQAAGQGFAPPGRGGPRGGFGGFGGFGGGGGTPEPGRRLAPADVRTYPASTALYDVAALRTIFLEFESSDWEAELADFHNTDVEVPAAMTVDGQTLKDVGVHFRGNSSYMMVGAGYKRSLNLSIDFVHERQAVGGYRTLNLLNANNDATFLRAVLYSEISRPYLATPRINYMRVVINGESWGIYLNAQQFNKDFTRDYFGTTEGARWKTPGRPGGNSGLTYLGESAESYKTLYEIKTKDTPKAWADLVRLTRVLNQTPPDALEAALSPILDIDGALKFLAIDAALVNSDGYWTRASDYSLYQDPKGVFHVLPYDVNEGLGGEGGGGPGGGRRGGFGGGGFGGGGADLDPLVGLTDSSKPLRSKLLAVPSLRAKYLGYVRDIAQKQMDWNAIAPRVRQFQALIAADVRADTRKLYSTEAFDSDVASLQDFFTRRRAFLLK